MSGLTTTMGDVRVMLSLPRYDTLRVVHSHKNKPVISVQDYDVSHDHEYVYEHISREIRSIATQIALME